MTLQWKTVLGSLFAVLALYGLGVVLDLDVRMAMSAIAVLLCVPVSALIVNREGVTPVAALVAGAMVFAAALQLMALVGDWHYLTASMTHTGDYSKRVVSLDRALERVEQPGVRLPLTNQSLTKRGLVSHRRVTVMIMRANTEMEAGHVEEARRWLRQAIDAAEGTPEEGIDPASIQSVLESLSPEDR